ncbi:hypothetical protein AgCh_005127 [Apium graveolens]
MDEECLKHAKDFSGLLLLNRMPEAALMARSYLPSKVSEIVALWRKDLNKVNQKAAESLADPEEYPNLFEDWQVALAAEYLNLNRSNANFVEAFRNMQMDEEQTLENGGSDYEVDELTEQKGKRREDMQVGQDVAAVVDADSTDSAVLFNGNEAEEEWDTIGNPSS